MWSRHSKLRALRLNSFDELDAVPPCLGHLPPSVRSLSIEDQSLYLDLPPLVKFVAQMGPLPSRLHDLYIVDRCEDPARRGGDTSTRGGWEAVLSRLPDLRKLTMSVCAVANLANALFPLKELAELELVAEYSVPTEPLAHVEVMAFLEGASALRRLVVGRDVWNEWPETAVGDMFRQAELKGVQLLLEYPERRGGPLVLGISEGNSAGDSEDGGDELTD